MWSSLQCISLMLCWATAPAKLPGHCEVRVGEWEVLCWTLGEGAGCKQRNFLTAPHPLQHRTVSSV